MLIKELKAPISKEIIKSLNPIEVHTVLIQTRLVSLMNFEEK